jgi:hypothetical protein
MAQVVGCLLSKCKALSSKLQYRQKQRIIKKLPIEEIPMTILMFALALKTPLMLPVLLLLTLGHLFKCGILGYDSGSCKHALTFQEVISTEFFLYFLAFYSLKLILF